MLLQLTRPIDSVLPVGPLEELINCVNSEYENPVFTVSLLAKISRKLYEPNIYTKIKSLLVIHKLIELTDSGARHAIMQCINSLQKEIDIKTGKLFFNTDTIDDMSKAASNVPELKAVDMAKEYAIYVLDFVNIRGDKTPLNQKSIDDVEDILKLISQSETVEEKCLDGIPSPSNTKSHAIQQGYQLILARECLERIKDDRIWILKHLQKIYEVGGFCYVIILLIFKFIYLLYILYIYVL